MLHALVYLGLILFGVLMGMGATGEEIYDAIFSVELPLYLFSDLKGVLIAVITGAYASLIVTRYQEFRHARDEAARAWAHLYVYMGFGVIPKGDEKLKFAIHEIKSARFKMALFKQNRAVDGYSKALKDVMELAKHESPYDDFGEEFMQIQRDLVRIDISWKQIFLFR
ncbi:MULTISPECIES: hypothetical protein [unclassified Neptuniibacter]|uniref:hypothetical protein n=1 Tax=unclassified Neptuniibacter TaxID=2630693 RepID=UPI000C35CB64|nr:MULTISPECIES: hypothetical protein [unclassified Neptuniibacter]MAY41687.1 hypothetical protein [Oceanospirillaceae bacterium]|tara:strand:- start:149 stop:652 length:504 start_codon:yes stop_codon:yes gene_type:complete